MDIHKCSACKGYFEKEDVVKVENRDFCYKCLKICENCRKPYDYRSDPYCYNCLEGDLVQR